MPALAPRSRRTLRLVLLVSALLLAAGGGYAFVEVGRFAAKEDPLQKGDAIFVFAGTLVERPLEAADLYRSGYAPIIVVTRVTTDRVTFALRRRGIRIPSSDELTTDILFQLGVPESALIIPAFLHDNTAEEARTLRELALEHGWKRVILVSSKYHLRRLALAARRELRGTNVEVLARGSRYDESIPDRWWWTRRRDIRWLLSEVPKLVTYALGVAT